MHKNKVLIAVTAYDKKKYIIDRFLDSLQQIYYNTINSNTSVDILIVDSSKTQEYADYIRYKGFNVESIEPSEDDKETLRDAYNHAREVFLEKDYDYFFSLEQDIIPDPDILNKLLKHKKNICSGLYYLGDKPCCMVGKVKEVPPGREREFRFETHYFKYDYIDQAELDKGKLIKVFAAGLGCMLIKRKILEKIKFRLIPDGNSHNDMKFSMDCRSMKFDIWLDPILKCRHFNHGYTDDKDF